MIILAFRDRLKALRNEKGITQEDLAQALGMPASTIRRYETHDGGMPKHERIQMIANYFNCTVDYLLERSNERFPSYKKKGDLPESVYEQVIKEAEIHYGVSLRDDPVVNSAVRELILSLAKMKKGSQ